MTEQSEKKPKINQENPTSDSIFKSALFIQVPNSEGIDYRNRNSMDYFNNSSMTPRMSDQNFKNYISSDLMRRLEESSPIKSQNSFDLNRKFSELNLISCEAKNEENEEEGVLSNQKSSIIKLEHMNIETENFNSAENYEIKSERLEKKDKIGESENVINAMKNLKAKNFMLKTQILKPQNEYLITDQESEESSNHNTISPNHVNFADNNNKLSREPNSLFNNMMNFGNMNFNQNGLVSPTYNTKQSKLARKDSSPFYSYYTDTSEYLSQNFYDEFNKNFNSDNPHPGDKNLINLDNTNNYIKKVTSSSIINNSDDNKNENFSKFNQQTKQIYNPAYNKFNLNTNNVNPYPKSNLFSQNKLQSDNRNPNINHNFSVNVNSMNNNSNVSNKNMFMNLDYCNNNAHNNSQNKFNFNQFDPINSFQIKYHNNFNKQVEEDEEDDKDYSDFNNKQNSLNINDSHSLPKNFNFQDHFPDQQMILNYMMNKDTPKKQNCKNASSSANVNSNTTNSSSQNQTAASEEDYIVEMFGRKGWICELCNNFNYETRMKCNRCGVNKSPKRNPKGRTAKNNTDNKSVSNDSTSEDTNSADRKTKKPFTERVGDWVCIKCKNLNFSFRIICNRCQLPKTESEKLFDNYMVNLMNYFKLNEMMQQQIFMNNNQFPHPNQPGYVNTNSININNNYFNQYPNNLPGNAGNNPGMKNVPLPNYIHNKNNSYGSSGGVNMSNFMGPKGSNVDSSVSHFEVGNKSSKKDIFEQEM